MHDGQARLGHHDHTINNEDAAETLSIEIGDLMITNVYFPPRSSDSQTAEVREEVLKAREKCHLDPSGSVYLAEKSVNCGFLMMRQIRMSAMESVTITW
uniref:Uncharacterized protein n=1 Tax=Caenorhabditis japonica TaxID=281687 RepID=A0A8R1E4J3_CAEJA